MLAADLTYSGVAYPLAKVTGATPLEYKSFSPAVPGFVQPPPKPRLIFRIAAAGREKPWQTSRAQAFWRTYGEFLAGADDPNCGEREAAFVRRFGPVNEPKTESGELVIYTAGYTGDSAQGFFQEIARAWEPEDASGLSRVSFDRKRRDLARHWLSRFVMPMVLRDMEIIFDPELRPLIQARSLYAYMALSAASQLLRQAPMRRCRHCLFWFEPPRADALYCSNACRVAHHVHIHGRASAPARPHKKKVRARG